MSAQRRLAQASEQGRGRRARDTEASSAKQENGAESIPRLICAQLRNMGIWVAMKTTIELPDSLFRRAKTAAVKEGMTLKQLFTEALESRLDSSRIGEGKAALPRWRRAYGALRHLRRERKVIEQAIESEFEKIEPEDLL
jgi:hypothetical protein